MSYSNAPKNSLSYWLTKFENSVPADYKGIILTIFTLLQNMYKALLKNSFLVRKKVSYKNAENADF